MSAKVHLRFAPKSALILKSVMNANVEKDLMFHRGAFNFMIN